MLLQCEVCQTKVSECAKIPCGFQLEREGDQLIFCMPTDETIYRNVCIDCILKM